MSRAVSQPRQTARRETPAAPSLRLAAIDVGSNSVHMVVAQADSDGGVTTLWRMKEMVGLGRMSFPSRRLSRDAIDRAIATLRRFRQAARQRQAERIIAVATSAIREATNGGDFIERAKRELGLAIRVVSARDEARLIYLAVRHAVPFKGKPHLILDVGGGSVEFIVGDERRAMLLESRKLGAARMTARFVKSDPISDADLAALRRHYESQLSPLVQSIASTKPAKCIGTSGTLENIAAMCGHTAGGNGSDGLAGVVERGALERLASRLIRSDAEERGRIRGLDDQRKEQILAGVVLVEEIMRRLKLKRIHLCTAALREGILLDYLSRHLPELAIRREVPDPRRRSVMDLARRCDWHKTHSEQVARLCLRLFDELRPLHGMGDGERELIEYAALLHDIGWHIAGRAHHKHAMYLILNGDLKSFTSEDVQIIAHIARYHRKSPPTVKHEMYRVLPPRARRVVDVGSALLRVADGLDRSHSNVIEDFQCRVGRKSVRCLLKPRAEAQLELWGAKRKAAWLEKVLHRRLRLILPRS